MMKVSWWCWSCKREVQAAVDARVIEVTDRAVEVEAYAVCPGCGREQSELGKVELPGEPVKEDE